MSNLTYRSLAPTAALASSMSSHGRSFAPSALYADAIHGDAVELNANSWMTVGRVGTTAQRPSAAVTDLHPIKRGEWYIDTTLGKAIIFDGTSFRDPVTGGVV